jgi:hypothetical protein
MPPRKRGLRRGDGSEERGLICGGGLGTRTRSAWHATHDSHVQLCYLSITKSRFDAKLGKEVLAVKMIEFVQHQHLDLKIPELEVWEHSYGDMLIGCFERYSASPHGLIDNSCKGKEIRLSSFTSQKV